MYLKFTSMLHGQAKFTYIYMCRLFIQTTRIKPAEYIVTSYIAIYIAIAIATQ